MDDAFRSGFASALLDVLFNRLANFIANEVDMIVNVDVSLRKLETNMMEARNLLNMVDHFHDNDALRRRADEVASFCYDADDLIDDIDREIKKQKLASGSRNPVRLAVKPTKNWLIPRRIDKLQKKLVEIIGDLRKNLELSQSRALLTTASLGDGLFSSKQHQKLVGRDEDIAFIVKELTSQEKSDSNGVSIVGMRGIGKTVLAHAILNHHEIEAKFPFILQVSMDGRSFSGEEVIAKLTIVHQNKIPGVLNDRSLEDLLARDEWLIFIDNLSEVPVMAWRDFQNSYLTTHGRKLLITSLSPKVATVAQTAVHYLKPLSDEHCQELVAHELTLLRNGCAIPPHESINLAKMSCGLPLVATFLGWSLARKIKGKYQLSTEEDFWSWPTFRKEILPILRSTFLHLEPHLKKCFVYLSLFSQGYHFDADDLILLWMGEGLVQPHASRLEQNGWENFNGLLEQSILQPTTSHGLLRYEIHKFIHYFAKVAGSKTYVQLAECASSSYGLNANTRHLSFSHNILPRVWDEIKCLRGLRTFLSINDNQYGLMSQIPRDFFKKMSRLRVLSLNKTDITELPDSVDRLKHLRYLDISNTSVQKLPETLSNLSTLQILKLKNDHGIPQLPKNFSNLTNLLFVDWNKKDIKNMQSKPCYIGNLIALRTLPLFIVGDKEGYRLTELKNMKNLQGSICISNLEMVKDGVEAQEATLSCKFSLQRLELEWTTVRKDTSAGDVLVGLKPHDNLKELQIVNYGFRTFPQWLSLSLLRLETLQLRRCYCTVLPALGQLPALKTLQLEEMTRLSSLDHHFSGKPMSGSVGCFPLLEFLLLFNLAELQEWIGLGAKDMPRLRELQIVDCPKLESLPSMSNLNSLVDLQIQYCETLNSLPSLPTSLQSLAIRGSDLVQNKCKEEGEDWGKVDRVKKVQIDGIEVPTSQRIHAPCSEPQNYNLEGFHSITNGVRSIFSRLF